MSRQIWKTIPLVFFIAVSVHAADENERQSLIGTWTMQDESGGSTGWVIDNKGDAFKIIETKGASTVADYSCKADGHDCEVKIAGKKATVSMWFSGPKLVQLESQGTNVVKRRFAVLPAGEGLEVEIIPIVPDGKAETVQFKRVDLTVRN